ncbi:MAG: putative transposase [Chloroflexota bacterium]|nr:putative transposase [Chloroflexota bacterium]
MVRWRLRYKLSLRDLAEMFLERGFEFTHEAVRDWEARFAPLIADCVPSGVARRWPDMWVAAMQEDLDAGGIGWSPPRRERAAGARWPVPTPQCRGGRYRP